MMLGVRNFLRSTDLVHVKSASSICLSLVGRSGRDSIRGRSGWPSLPVCLSWKATYANLVPTKPIKITNIVPVFVRGTDTHITRGLVVALRCVRFFLFYIFKK